MKKHRLFLNFFLSVLFIIIIFFVIIDKVFIITNDIKNSENRTLATIPILDINKLDAFPSNYENYFNDHFTFRNLIIRYYSYFNAVIIKKSPTHKVIIGKNDWYFYNEIHGNAYRGILRFNKQELSEFRKEIYYRNNFLSKRGIKYYFVIVPTKYSVYSEYLPYYFKPLNPQTMADQITNLFKNDTNINIIDIRQAIRNAKIKTNLRLYYKTDSHWNFAGGFFGYQAIINYIKRDFPKIYQTKFEDYNIDSVEFAKGDLAKFLSLENILSENKIIFTPKFKSNVTNGEKHNYDCGNFKDTANFEKVKINKSSHGPKAIFVVDSYNHGLENFMPESFHKCVFIWDNWEYKLNENIVESEKPDAMFTIIAECQLKEILKNLSYKNAK